MSFYDWVKTGADKVGDWGEAVYESAADKVGDVKEYFTGDDDSVSNEVDAVPGSNNLTQDRLGGVTPNGINWTAAGVVIGALTLASKFLK